MNEEMVTREVPGAPPGAGEGVHPLAALLKSPAWLAGRIGKEEKLWERGALLLARGLIFHGLYGIAMGLFGGEAVASMDAGKAPLIALCSIGLCAPSLYIFSCVGGAPITAAQCFALAGCAVGMTGLLLLGLAPVAWLFSVSTESVPFVTILNVAAWSVAVAFALRFFRLFARTGAPRRSAGLGWWLAVYILVSFQMATVMRPLLAAPAKGWRYGEKKFFLAHFGDSVFRPHVRPEKGCCGRGGRR